MHSTGLTPEAELTVINCALRFDGYAYAQASTLVAEKAQGVLPTLLGKAQSTGKFSTYPTENFAANYYLHRCFYGQGTLPTQFTQEWYDMVLYYLHLYRLPTPPAHCHASATDWDHRSKGAAERAAAEIRMLLRRHSG